MQHIKAGPFSSFANRLAQLRDGHSGKQGERWDLLSSGTHTHTHTHTIWGCSFFLTFFCHKKKTFCHNLCMVVMWKCIKVCEKMFSLDAFANNTYNLWITACILIERLSTSKSLGLYLFVFFLLCADTGVWCVISDFLTFYCHKSGDFYSHTSCPHILGQFLSDLFRLFFKLLLKWNIQTLRTH